MFKTRQCLSSMLTIEFVTLGDTLCVHVLKKSHGSFCLIAGQNPWRMLKPQYRQL
ncbi:hypothetical protein LA635_1884 [Erwinia amylovora LA635]|nr:hypothetical protein LA635_1884 [Erwinia amylovora LA635]CDK18875.1 hypothetical protein LA636_1883 [Erwinia amylovora LA636]CDK22245.1 hypothetical protein LA637_1885 [Erwinia amylovora LA637]